MADFLEGSFRQANTEVGRCVHLPNKVRVSFAFSQRWDGFSEHTQTDIRLSPTNIYSTPFVDHYQRKNWKILIQSIPRHLHFGITLTAILHKAQIQIQYNVGFDGDCIYKPSKDFDGVYNYKNIYKPSKAWHLFVKPAEGRRQKKTRKKRTKWVKIFTK